MFARTERLLLRPGWPEDAPALAAALGDEAVVRNLARVPWPYTPADAEAWLAQPDGGSLPRLLVFARDGGVPRLVGGVGLHRDGAGQAELGYWIARAEWGRGFVTEAAGAVLATARDALRLPRVVACHALDNPASGRVLRKLGFRPTGRCFDLPSAGRGEAMRCAGYLLDLCAPDALAA